MEWQLAPKLQKRVKKLVCVLNFSHIDSNKVIVFRGFGSKSRATARIWSLPRIWQKALKVKPHYCLEVLAEKFDNLSREHQDKILIHELLHIPKNFSGALLPHKGRKRRISDKVINKLFELIKNDNHSR